MSTRANYQTDIVRLRTSDNEIVEIPDYLLKAYSPVFRDMLSIPVPNHSPTDAITVTESSSTLRAFVDSIDAPMSSIATWHQSSSMLADHFDKHDYEVCYNLVQFAQKFEVDRMLDFYKEALDGAYSRDPAGAFIHHISLGDMQNAPTYISYMHTKIKHGGTTYRGQPMTSLDPSRLDRTFVKHMGFEVYQIWVEAWRRATEQALNFVQEREVEGVITFDMLELFLGDMEEEFRQIVASNAAAAS